MINPQSKKQEDPRVHLITLSQEIKLNEKQRIVMENLLNGLTYKSIAANINISVPAVRQYAHRLCKKLGVSNRTKAVI
jgi:DNA-binding NarL/FixJ family response regulator